MNIHEAVKSEKKDLSGTAMYVASLSSLTSTPIDSWDILKVFGTKDGVVTDRNEINKRFFKEAGKFKKEVKELSKKNQEILEKVEFEDRELTDRQRSKIEKLLSKKNKKLETAKKLCERYTTLVSDAFKIRKEIELIENRKKDLAKQAAEIVRDGFWEFYKLTKESLIFVTRADVVVAHKNPARGIDIQVNLGRFKGFIDLSEGYIYVGSYKNNVHIDGIIHPHAYDEDEICWGSAYDVANRMQAEGDYVPLFRLLATLLTSYNDSNPYEQLYRFEEVASERKRRSS
jgi:hypothetical protein